MYRNSEGYPSPTESEVILKMMSEYRKKVREMNMRNDEIKHRPKAYIVSKYAGDIRKNVAEAIRFCKLAIRAERIPIASHLLYPQILNDYDPQERELGMLFGQALLAMCDEVWICGTDYSSGMKAEIKEAKRLKKHIIYYDGKDGTENENDR